MGLEPPVVGLEGDPTAGRPDVAYLNRPSAGSGVFPTETVGVRLDADGPGGTVSLVGAGSLGAVEVAGARVATVSHEGFVVRRDSTLRFQNSEGVLTSELPLTGVSEATSLARVLDTNFVVDAENGFHEFIDGNSESAWSHALGLGEVRDISGQSSVLGAIDIVATRSAGASIELLVGQVRPEVLGSFVLDDLKVVLSWPDVARSIDGSYSSDNQAVLVIGSTGVSADALQFVWANPSGELLVDQELLRFENGTRVVAAAAQRVSPSSQEHEVVWVERVADADGDYDRLLFNRLNCS